MTNFAKRLGYGGSATVDSVQVLITSGGMEQADTPSYLEMWDIDPTLTAGIMGSRSRVLHSDGVSSFTGSLSFDVTANAMSKITKNLLLARGYSFPVGINDGENYWEMSSCYITNLTLSGAPGGIVTSSISYMAKDARTVPISPVTNNYILDDYTISTSNQPLGYWWSGGVDIKEWTFTMNQAVSPVYLNQPVMTPKYLKVGLVDYQLDATVYNSVTATPSVISVQTASFTLTGVMTAKGYTFNGITDLGMYSHTFVTAVTGTSTPPYDSSAMVIA